MMNSLQCKNNDSCKKLSGNDLDQLQIFAHIKHFLVVIKVILKQFFLYGGGSSRGSRRIDGSKWGIQSHVEISGSGAEGLVCLFNERELRV